MGPPSLCTSGLPREVVDVDSGVRCSNMALNDYSRTLRWTVRNCAKLSDQPDAIIADVLANLPRS